MNNPARWLASATLATLWAAPGVALSQVIDGPAAPVAPAVITRNAAGQATVRAIKLSAPLKLDGVLDEEVYKREAPFGGLIQVAPNYGAPSTEKSEIWITYDDKNMYLTCRCYDASPPSEWSSTKSGATRAACATTNTSACCSTPSTTGAAVLRSTQIPWAPART